VLFNHIIRLAQEAHLVYKFMLATLLIFV